MPPTPRARCILHLDADAFFASLEQRDDPRLRGRPVAVGTGVVASCSYEARRWGVTTGMRLAEARRLCRGLIVVPGEYARYEQAARRVLGICEEHTPAVEVAALDDLYLDLTGRVEPPQSPRLDDTPAGRIAADLRAVIREEVSLSISIGVGSNKLVARVATRQAKPGRQVGVALGAERDYLAPWPVRVLPGAGGKAGDRLERFNVLRVGEVAGMPAPLLRGLFGVARGTTLHEQARGIDPRPVEPRRMPQSVSRRTSFDPPVADRAFLAAMLGYLLERVCSWLRFHALATRGLGVTIRYGDYAAATGRETFRRPVEDEGLLKEMGRERLGRLYQRRLPLRYLGVELAPVVRLDEQPALFIDPDEERARRLVEVRDAIRGRFGFTALLSGSALELAEQLDRDRETFKLRTPCLHGAHHPYRRPVS
ncbi:MAG: DNA polymerase IV [Gemmataceae bacterium]|nr:DNA polymerase IV [Gemmataceae bacterium]